MQLLLSSKYFIFYLIWQNCTSIVDIFFPLTLHQRIDSPTSKRTGTTCRDDNKVIKIIKIMDKLLVILDKGHYIRQIVS